MPAATGAAVGGITPRMAPSPSVAMLELHLLDFDPLDGCF